MHLLIAFLLLQNMSISGTLKDADGKSISGVRVAAMPVDGTSLVGTTITDREGRYTLELPPGAYYVVAGSAFWPNFYTANGSRVVIRTSRDGVDFVVRPLLRREEWPPRRIQRDVPLQWDVPPTPPKFPLWPR